MNNVHGFIEIIQHIQVVHNSFFIIGNPQSIVKRVYKIFFYNPNDSTRLRPVNLLLLTSGQLSYNNKADLYR